MPLFAGEGAWRMCQNWLCIMAGWGASVLRHACALACLLASVVVRSLHGQDDSFWSFLKPGTVVTRCAESSAAAKQARARLDDLNGRIARLEDSASPAGIVDEIHALLKTECFLLAAETDRIPRPDTSLSLKQWWGEGGGGIWLWSYAELLREGEVQHLKPSIVVPSDAPRTLNLEAHRDHPLQSLLCPLSDAACGAATRGWRARADRSFEAHRALRREAPSATAEERASPAPPDIARACVGKVSRASVREKYQMWRACIEEQRPKRTALPLGEFRAPDEGWLVISGRRGHYSFCDTTRAYDLRTGAAFINDSCSALVLNADGSVEADATRKASVPRVAAGSVPVQNLQEALWMMLFREEAEEMQVSAASFPLPDGFVPRLTIGPRRDAGFDTSVFSWNTSQTSLTWQWTPATGPAFVGNITWPNSGDAAEDHAAVLLEIAERAFSEGCAARRLPADLLRSSDTRHLNDVSDEQIRDLAADLSRALKDWKSVPLCEPRR
jgi:hypothetical protein